MFHINVDPSEITGYLTVIQERQIPFTVSLALNRVANIAQKAEQDRLRGSFHLRRESWMVQGIKIDKADRATKSTWRVVIQVQADRDFLDRMEAGGIKEPTKGHWLWRPNQDVFGDRIIMRSNPLHPSKIHFNQHMQADNRVFMVKSNGSKTGPLVLQRTGAKSTGYDHTAQLRTVHGRFDGQIRRPGERKKKQGIRLLYTLISKTHVPKKLEFIDTISAAVSASWEPTMADALQFAMRTAR